MRATLFTTLVLTGLIGVAPHAGAQEKPQDGTSRDTSPATSQERSIRNAPSPRAMEFAAYIYAASNVCGYRIGPQEFEAILAKQGVKPEDVGPRGPFANRITGMFTLMSNQMVLNREQSCLAVAGEYGPEGSIARNVLQPPQAGDGSGPSKPAQ